MCFASINSPIMSDKQLVLIVYKGCEDAERKKRSALLPRHRVSDYQYHNDHSYDVVDGVAPDTATSICSASIPNNEYKTIVLKLLFIQLPV